ncbi:MAG TPA: hypothetical protein PKC97_14955 [Burkholderiaceae bacterium]|nr:hypothetical protein [Burkholderiaceae bacterium]
MVSRLQVPGGHGLVGTAFSRVRRGAIDAMPGREAMGLRQNFLVSKALNMRAGARDLWIGAVRSIRVGAVNDQIELGLPGGRGAALPRRTKAP